MAQARAAVSNPPQKPAHLDAKAADDARRQKLLAKLNDPTPEFLESLLNLNRVKSEKHAIRMLMDVAHIAANVDKDRLLQKIKELDEELRTDILCMAQREETCFGILFAATHKDKIEAFLAPEVKACLEKAYHYTWNIIDHPGMEEFSEKALKLAPNNPKARAVVIGAKAREDDDFRLVDRAPGKVSYYSVCGTMGETVLRGYKEVLRLQPDNASAHFRIGLLERRRGNYSNALEHLIKALSIRSDFKLADRWRAEASLMRDYMCRQLAEAYHKQVLTLSAEQILNVQPGHALVYFQIAMLEVNRERYKSAIKYYNHALSIASDDLKLSPEEQAAACQQRGFSYSRIGEYEKAIADYNASQAKPDSYRNLYRSAYQAAIRQGSTYFFQLLMEFPDHEIFDGIVSEEIDKDKLFSAINALEDKRLKQNLLCQMLSHETFLGKVFYKKQGHWDQMFAPNVERGKLESAVKVLYEIIDAKEEFNLNSKTIEALAKDKTLPMANPKIQKICQHIAKRLVNDLENPQEDTLNLLLKPFVWKIFNKEVLKDVRKDKLLDAIKRLNNKELKQELLRCALLPRTLFNNIFADDQMEIARLFIAEVGFQYVLSDEAIKNAFSNKDFQEELAQQDSGFCRDLRAFLGASVVVMTQAVAVIIPAAERSVSLKGSNSATVAYQAFGVSPADVSHAAEPEHEEPGAADLQPGAPEAEIRPDCDGAQPAAAAAFVPERGAQPRRKVVYALNLHRQNN